jgi:hypothetical protein
VFPILAVEAGQNTLTTLYQQLAELSCILSMHPEGILFCHRLLAVENTGLEKHLNATAFDRFTVALTTTHNIGVQS